MGTFEKIRDDIHKGRRERFQDRAVRCGRVARGDAQARVLLPELLFAFKEFYGHGRWACSGYGASFGGRPDTSLFFENELPENYDKKLERVNIRHLLTQTMGCGEGYLFEGDRFAHGTDDWARYILSQPLEHEPGEKFVYSNSTFYLLSCIVHRASGMTAEIFLRDRLLSHIWHRILRLGNMPEGRGVGRDPAYTFRRRTLAKLGVLYLNKGEYEGKRLVSRQWAEDAVRLHAMSGRWGNVWLQLLDRR